MGRSAHAKPLRSIRLAVRARPTSHDPPGQFRALQNRFDALVASFGRAGRQRGRAVAHGVGQHIARSHIANPPSNNMGGTYPQSPLFMPHGENMRHLVVFKTKKGTRFWVPSILAFQTRNFILLSDYLIIVR